MNENKNLYEEAKQIVISNNNYSISFLQRKLQISYNRASELMKIIQKSEVKVEANFAKLTSDKIAVIGIGGAGGNIIHHCKNGEKG